jgi:hypothetical protein
MPTGKQQHPKVRRGKQREPRERLPENWELNLEDYARSQERTVFELTRIAPNTWLSARKHGGLTKVVISKLTQRLKFKRHDDVLRMLRGEMGLSKRPTMIIPNEFVLICPQKSNPQGAHYRDYRIDAVRPWTLRCHIATESPYFRFGFKLLEEEEGLLFGDGVIASSDDNLVIHIGRNDYDRPRIGITAKDIFWTAYHRGLAVEATDRRLFASDGRVEVPIELTIDRGGEFASMTVNGHLALRRKISRSICGRVAIFAWADREECRVEVTDLIVGSI